METPETDRADDHVETAVVGLGASAGGIKALQAFFANVPSDSGAAYVVILHLSPEHESRLAEVLQHCTRMPVARVSETVRIQPDHVYVISPNTSLRIADGSLTVSEVQLPEERRSPVDVFFRALANAHATRAICVVLSGTGPNGSNGLKRVKEYGGIVLAQDPSEADHDDMPKNAIATGMVDCVLPVADIPAKIATFLRLRRAPPSIARDVEHFDESQALGEILTVVRVRTGHDFSHYKPATVLRRIERRRGLHELADLFEYSRFIHEHPEETVALYKELLISVTHFFREPEAFAALERTIVPRLFAGLGTGAQLRVWVAGCATGEEAYSVAMLLAEAAGEPLYAPPIQVFATDLDAEAIAAAREGVFTEADIADVSSERLRRFFVRTGSAYRVRRDLREMVLFAHHNVLKDPPFSHLELICCRNLLIYLNRGAQTRLLETFHFALNPGGYLFLGTSESIEATDQFVPIDKSAHLYQSGIVATRAIAPRLDGTALSARRGDGLADRTASRATDRVSGGDLHQRLLELYGPPSIVVNEEHQVVHVSDKAGAYLHVAPGELSRELGRLIRPELRVEVRTALYQAARDRVAVDVQGLAIAVDGRERRVNVLVRPVFLDPDEPRAFYLVLFEEAIAASGPAPIQLTSPLAADAVQHLEDELVGLKAQLRTTIDQYETQAEEFKAANEELQAVNEELRSAAEELETSKEELQSVNEELTTVNQELKIKIEELGATNNDFQNLINSTDIGTVFLDRSLRVKLSTPRARDVFNLLPLDAGRPLGDITSRLLYDHLQEDVDLVLERLQAVEREVQTRDGDWYLLRVLPYRTTDERIDGIVMTFQNITARRRDEARVHASEERLRLLIDSVRDYAIFTITPGGIIDSWNPGGERMFGYTEKEIVGQPFDRLFTEEDRAAGMAGRELAQARTERRADDERWHVRKDGTRLYCSGVTTPLGANACRGFAKIARDLTVPRRAEKALLAAHEELEDRVRVRTRALQTEVEIRSTAERRVTTLVRELVSAQEDERARIARDIHDQIGQQLTALRLSLDRLAQRQETASGADLAHAQAIAQEMDAELDFLAWQLRPAALDDLGLVVALGKYLEAWSSHHGIAAEFRKSGFDGARLPPATETTFYRVAQEALNNIAKHAHASRVDAILEHHDSTAVLVVEDDGIGFDRTDGAAHGGFGLDGMRERAALIGAELQIESAPGKGTTVFLRAPLRTAGPDA
jgi:two-component system, chemotaxis family, CheB/CheR fusion protein